MITRFAQPYFLALLLLLPLWLWAQRSARLRVSLRFPHAAALRALPRTWALRLQPLLPVLALSGLALCIVALARPQSGLNQRRITANTIDIVLAIDVSTSMEAVDFSEQNRERNRLQAVIDVADAFIRGRPADRIGLIAFAAQPLTHSPLTLDHGWLLQRLHDLKTRQLPDGTAIGSAIASAANRLRSSEAKSRIIILLTDGIQNAGDISPAQAATLAESLGIRLYTIGAGAEGPVLLPMTDPFGRRVYNRVLMPIDDALLTRIAETTGGRHFRARDAGQLKDIFEEIDRLERTEIELTEYTQYDELFLPIAAAGLALLLLERLLAAGRLGRVLA